MKKIIILFLSLIILTGCQIKYELQFEDENLIENINVELKKNDENKIEEIKKYKVYSAFDNNYQKLYKVNYNEGINNFNANYQYTYNFDEFRHALYIKSCFDAFSFVTSNDNYILSTSQGFNCMFVDYNKVDNVEVVINSNHEIIESNADEIKNNKLIWNINDDNAESKSIYVKFGSVKQLSFFDKILKFINNNFLTFTIIGGLFLIIVITVMSIIIIGKKNNEI